MESSKLVTTHNNLINGQFYMTLLEMRLFFVLLSRIVKGQSKFNLEKVFYSEFMPNGEDMEGSDYRNAKAAAARLADRKIMARRIATDRNGKQSEVPVAIPIFAMQGTEERFDELRGSVALKFSEEIREYLLDLKGNYTRSNFEDLMKLTHQYSPRMYMLINEYAAFGSRVIKIEELKKMLMLPDTYRWSHIEDRVIKPYKEESQKTTMPIEYTVTNRKAGRAVEMVKFELLQQQKPEPKHKKTQIKGKPNYRVKWVSQDELLEIHEHNLNRKITDIENFSEWVNEIYIKEGFTKQKVNNVWGVIKHIPI